MARLKGHEDITRSFLAAIRRLPGYEHVGGALPLFEVRPDFRADLLTVRELCLPLSPATRERAARALHLPVNDDRTQALWAEVVTFCVVPLNNWQAGAKRVLDSMAHHWRGELREAKRALEQMRLQPVPFARFLLDESPDDWVRVAEVTVDATQFVDDAPEASRSHHLWFLVRPFITWAIDVNNPLRHVALTDGGVEVAINRPQPQEAPFRGV